MDPITTPEQVIQSNSDTVKTDIKGKSKLESISFVMMLITLILLPISFIPSVYVPSDMIKTIIVIFGTLLSAILYFFNAFKNKTLSIPRHPLFNISFAIIISLVVSTLVSTNVLKSLFGRGFEIGTTGLLSIMFLSSLLSVFFIYKNNKRIKYLLGSVFLSFIIVSIFHIIRFVFGSDTLTFGVFKNGISTMLGSWNDLGLLAGVVSILSYLMIRYVKTTKLQNISIKVLLAVSGIFILLVNSVSVWSITLITFILIAVYEYSNSNLDIKGFKGVYKKVSVLLLVIIAISVVGLWQGNRIAVNVTNKIGINQSEVYLPWQLTLDVTTATIKESPLFGVGPNRFGNQFLKFKPLIINQTQFWSTEFNDGFGLIPTFLATQGIVGFILWIALIIAFLVTGFKALKKKYDDQTKFYVLSTFLVSMFLWISTLVHVPSHSTLFLTFVLSGAFLALVLNSSNSAFIQFEKIKRFSLHRLVSAFTVIIIVFCILSLAVYIKKTVALGYFHGGIGALNTQNSESLLKAENNFKNALSMDKSDAYYQALSEVNILKVTNLAQQLQSQAQKDGKPDQESVKKITSLIEEAVQYSKNAIGIDPTNYYNYIAEARISELALSLQVAGAYQNTHIAYENAIKNNPYNPLIYLSLARIEASQNKIQDAQKNIGMALQLKPDYLEAIYLLSQIQVSQGQIKDAITSVKFAAQINPSNPIIYFQLGLLYYSDKNYQEAINTFNQAIKLDEKYANAKYYLGLSHANVGNNQDAIKQFEDLTISNPDNQEVKLILENLKSGRNPFSNAKPPIDSKPEKRKSLPIKEKVENVVTPTVNP